MNERDIAQRIITRLEAGVFRLEPALWIDGKEYSAAKLTALDAGKLWGPATARYVTNFLTCIRNNRHKPAPRHLAIVRESDDDCYPADLRLLDAAGWQTTEIIVTYVRGNPKVSD